MKAIESGCRHESVLVIEIEELKRMLSQMLKEGHCLKNTPRK
jgi:hypothetical protein